MEGYHQYGVGSLPALYKKGCTRLAVIKFTSYLPMVGGSLRTPGTPSFSTTKTGRQDIAEILLKLVLNTKNQINSK
jgi:hypothetical protein